MILARKLISDQRRKEKAAAKKKNQTAEEPGDGGTTESTADSDTVKDYILSVDAKGDPTLWVVAQGVLDVLKSSTWYFYVARFDSVSGSYNAARQAIKDNRINANLLWVVDSLDSHVVRLRDIYTYILPRAVTALRATFPTLPSEALAYCVAMTLDAMFEGINSVVSMYASALRQEMDELYPVLDGLRVFLQSTYSLFETGDPTGCQNCIPALKTRIFKAGSRFLLLCGTDGPATISGGQELLKGPIGVHLGLVNLNELLMLLFELPIYGHENYHNIYWDVEGFADEMAKKVVRKFTDWQELGKFKFSTEFILIGGQKVPILPFLISVVVQQLPEIAADLPGGVMFSGPAYWKAVFQLFLALNSGKRNVLGTSEGLRTDSVFDLTKRKMALYDWRSNRIRLIM